MPSSSTGSKGKILFGWELGGGLGHVSRLLHLARPLQQEGYEPVFVLREVVETSAVLENDSYVLQAPFYQAPPPSSFSAVTFADVLYICGFGSASTLLPLVNAWNRILDLVKPGLIVCDHAPSLMLAAYQQLPTVIVGNGFTIPNVQGPLTQLREPDSESAFQQREKRVLETMGQVQSARRQDCPSSIQDLFGSFPHFVTIFKEFDPHSGRNPQCYSGPLEELPDLTPLPSEKRLFVYLAGEDSRTDSVVEQLVEASFACEFYIRGMTEHQKKLITESKHVLHTKPISFKANLSRFQAVVHHASLNTAETALKAGRLQFVFPRHLEQAITARKLEEMGVGINCSSELEMENLTATIQQFLDSDELLDHVQEEAKKFKAHSHTAAKEKILAACRKLL